MDTRNFDHIKLTMDEEYAAFKILLDAKKRSLSTVRYGEMILEGKTELEAAKISKDYEDSLNVDLTEEEVEFCIKKAKEEKFYRLKTNEYYESLKHPKTYIVPSKEQYRKFVIDRIESMIPAGEKFEPNEQFEMLLLYFMGDKAFEKCGEYYSLSKGILLVGPIGCGKSTLMKAFSVNPHQSYSVVTCRNIANQYTHGGPAAIRKYYNYSDNKMPQLYFGQQKLGWCPDDIGTEKVAQYFGNELDTVADIYSSWYDNNGNSFHGLHGTTNMDGPQIEERYDARLRSRFRPLFNMITFDKNEKDKRK